MVIPVAKTFTKHEEFDILNMQMFEKHPKISKATRSHQDNAYFKVTPADAITIWLALDDIDENNGCIYYAPKTHMLGTLDHQRYGDDTTFRVRSGVSGLSLCVPDHIESNDIPMITKAGDVLVHHCNMIHRAGANNSDKRRRAIGIVLIPKSCQPDSTLVARHLIQLKEDIELQKNKDPKLYKQLRTTYNHLF